MLPAEQGVHFCLAAAVPDQLEPNGGVYWSLARSHATVQAAGKLALVRGNSVELDSPGNSCSDSGNCCSKSSDSKDSASSKLYCLEGEH